MKNKILATIIIFTFCFLIFDFVVHAQQAISLSVSPPIFEATIKPGKEVKQIYTLTNNGGDTLITPRIVYFNPNDNDGNVNLTDNEAPDWIKYDKTPFNLKFGDEKQFIVLVSPTEDTEQVDHYLTLIFESNAPTDILGQSSIFYKSQIGTNILLSVSNDGNPKKSAEIVEFKAPKIIDSYFGKIKYDLIIRNNGNSYWKPIGKIIFNQNQNLKLASLNVISGASRKISCIDNEILMECEASNNIIIGKVKSNLEFTIDEEPKVYKQELITYVFPFTYIGIGLLLLTVFKFRGIFKVWVRKR